MHEENKKIATNLIIIITILFIVYIPCFFELIKTWISNPDYCHGFLVLPVTIYLVWMGKDKITIPEKLEVKNGMVLIIIGLILYIIGIYGRINSFSNISILITLLGVFLYVLGRKNTKLLLFPTFFLIFMFPVPESFFVRITGSLKVLITQVSTVIIQLVGIPVLREGNILHFANTSIQVVEACSGIRSIISYLMAGFLFMYILKKGVIRKVIMVLSAFMLAIIVNILRICGIGVLSHYFGHTAAQSFFHGFSGFVLLILGVTILFSEYWFLSI